MGNNSRLRDMAAAFIGNDIPGVADIHICGDSTATQASYQYWNKWAQGEKECFHTTIPAAYAACTGGRNDVTMITPDNHTLTATLTMNENMTHLIGMYPTSMMNMRSRIGHSVTVDPLIEVTGYGNLIKNIYTMYGLNNSTDLTCLKMSGNRNTLKNCHIAAPQHATPADESTYCCVNLTSEEYYFDHCTFGLQTSIQTDGDMFRLDVPCNPRMVFENCNFLQYTDNAQVSFFNFMAGTGIGFMVFKNCYFLNQNTALTVAFSGSPAAGTVIYCSNTAIHNCTDLIAAADEAKLVFPNVGGAVAVADEVIGMTTPYDHTV